MNGSYSTDLQKRQSYSKTSSDDYASGFSSGFILPLAQPYPSIADELKKDVAILTSSLRIRDDYIDKLRKTRDSLTSQLDFNLMQLESLEAQIKSYQELFKKNKGERIYQ